MPSRSSRTALELVHDAAQFLHLAVLPSSLLMLEMSRAPTLRQRWGQEKETDSFCFLLLRSHDDLGEQSRRKPSRGIDAREASRTLTGGGCTELGEVGHGRSEAEAWVLVRRRSRQRGAPASGRRCPRAGQGRRRRASRTIYGRRLQVLLPESYGRRGTAPPCSRIRLAGGRSVGGMGEGEGEGWEWGRRRRWVG